MSDSFGPMDCSMPGFPVLISKSLLRFMSIELVMLSNHLILCCPLNLSTTQEKTKQNKTKPLTGYYSMSLRFLAHWTCIMQSSKFLKLLWKSNRMNIHVKCFVHCTFSIHVDGITAEYIHRLGWIEWPSHTIYPSLEHC